MSSKQIQVHFKQLQTQVQQTFLQANYFERYAYEHLKMLLRFIGLFACLALFALPSTWIKIASFPLLSAFYFGAVVSGTHQAGHWSLATSKWANRVWGYFYADFLSGQNFEFWHARHTLIHHSYTNIPGKEPQQYVFPWMNKYVYFFLVPLFIVFWISYSSLEYLIQKKKYKTLLLHLGISLLGWIAQAWCFHQLGLNWAQSYLLVLAMRSLYGPFFMQVAIFNHVRLLEPQDNLIWPVHQTSTTRNIHAHPLLSLLGGNAFIQCHIEHHLFPRLSNHMLKLIQPLTLKFAQENQLPYIEESYTQVLSDCLENYSEVIRFGQEADPESNPEPRLSTIA